MGESMVLKNLTILLLSAYNKSGKQPEDFLTDPELSNQVEMINSSSREDVVGFLKELKTMFIDEVKGFKPTAATHIVINNEVSFNNWLAGIYNEKITMDTDEDVTELANAIRIPSGTIADTTYLTFLHTVEFLAGVWFDALTESAANGDGEECECIGKMAYRLINIYNLFRTYEIVVNDFVYQKENIQPIELRHDDEGDAQIIQRDDVVEEALLLLEGTESLLSQDNYDTRGYTYTKIVLGNNDFRNFEGTEGFGESIKKAAEYVLDMIKGLFKKISNIFKSKDYDKQKDKTIEKLNKLKGKELKTKDIDAFVEKVKKLKEKLPSDADDKLVAEFQSFLDSLANIKEGDKADKYIDDLVKLLEKAASECKEEYKEFEKVSKECESKANKAKSDASNEDTAEAAKETVSEVKEDIKDAKEKLSTKDRLFSALRTTGEWLNIFDKKAANDDKEETSITA